MSVVGAAALALPASSFATAYYASDADSGTADCLSAANSCTIATALGEVADDPATDVLHLAAGDYNDAEDKLDVDGAGFDGLVIQGAGRDQTILNQNPGALNVKPFTFGGLSDNQTVKDLTLKSAAASGALRTVELTFGSLIIENVDVYGATDPASFSHIVVHAHSGSPNLTLKGVGVFHAPETATPAGGGRAVEFFSDGPTAGELKVEESTIDVAAGPTRATGISVGGVADATVSGTVVRMRTTGDPIQDRGTGIFLAGVLPPDNTSLTVADSAITGGGDGIYVSPHPNQDNYRASATIERTSVDAGAIGVSEAGNVHPANVTDITVSAYSPGQHVDMTLRDVVAAGSLEIGNDVTATLALTCQNNFIGNPAGSVIAASSGSCTNNNTSPLAEALPDLTAVNAENTGVTPAQALATAFRPGDSSVLLDTATGIAAPQTDLAGNPRLVDAGDADCLAQADRGAYERQGLGRQCSTDLAVTNTADPATVVGGGTTTLTATATNAGADPAQAATLTETLAAGLVLQSVTPVAGAACSTAGQAVICSLGNLAPGASRSVEIVAKTPTSPGLLTSTASVAHESVESAPANDTAAATVTVVPSEEVVPPLEVELKGKRKQTAEKLKVKAICSVECDVSLKATGKADGKKFKSKTAKPDLGDDGEGTVKIKFSKKTLKKIGDEAGKATIKISATDEFGQQASDSLNVKLKP